MQAKSGRSHWGLGLCFLLVACGGDDAGNSAAKGGSCSTADGCWQVDSPPDYDVATECSFVSGAWSAMACNPQSYARKCTQVTQVSVNGGPEQDVTYVYFWPADSSFGCLGTEEQL